MTDPDLVFDMDPQNVRRVEQWIAGRWPAAAPEKQADGSRMTWSMQGASGSIHSVMATESFLSLPPGDVDRHLEHARTLCDAQPDDASCHLLLSTDGAQLVESV